MANRLTEMKREGMEESMKKFMEEFKAFALRGNMMDMAVGMIIGAAFSGIVTSLTENFIQPILHLITTGKTYSLQEIGDFASAFLSALINFLIMAFVLFCLLKGMNTLTRLGRGKKEEDAKQGKVCPYCKSKIDKEATRCPYCTSMLDVGAE